MKTPIFHLRVDSPIGTTTFPVKAPTLDAAVRIAHRSGRTGAEPMIGPQSRLYYRCVGC